jgi:hypothetical protein
MGGATDFSLDRFIPVTFGAVPAPAAIVQVKAGKVQITVTNAKGNKATFVVNGKKYVRNVTSDKLVFTVAAPKGKFVATASVLGKQLVKAKLTN